MIQSLLKLYDKKACISAAMFNPDWMVRTSTDYIMPPQLLLQKKKKGNNG